MRYLIIIIFSLAISSCSKENNKASQQFFYLRNNGSDMPVWAEGNFSQDKFVLVVHGGPGGNGQIYNALTGMSDPLEKEFVMLYWDQRGSGNSKGKLKKEDYKITNYIDDLDKLVDLIHAKYGQNKKVYLLGHSWGGTLTAAYLTNAARAAKVAGWIELDGAHDFGNNTLVHQRILDESGRQKLLAGANQSRWEEIHNAVSIINPASPSDAQISQLNAIGFEMGTLLIDSIANDGGEFDAAKFTFNSAYNPLTATLNEMQTNSWMFSDLKTANYTNQLDNLAIPSLFMWGRHDYVVPVESGIELYNRIQNPDKTMVIFTASGHSPMSNQLSDFLDVLTGWLRSH
jgi:pimeloyl-ACP methyl ester carboxylesterase